MTQMKRYVTTCSNAGNRLAAPDLAIFDIDFQTAAEIVQMAALARAFGIQKIEKADRRVKWILNYEWDLLDPNFEHTPDIDTLHWDDSQLLRTEEQSDLMIITAADFGFSCKRWNMDEWFYTESIKVTDLCRDFNLAMATVDKTQIFKNWPELLHPRRMSMSM